MLAFGDSCSIEGDAHVEVSKQLGVFGVEDPVGFESHLWQGSSQTVRLLEAKLLIWECCLIAFHFAVVGSFFLIYTEGNAKVHIAERS